MEHIDKLIKAYRHKDPDTYELRLHLSVSIPRREAKTTSEEKQNHRDFAEAHRSLRSRITKPIIEEIIRTREEVFNECCNPSVRLDVILKSFHQLLQKIEPTVKAYTPNP